MSFKELLELFKEGKYEIVIKEAESINDFNAVFLLVRSLIALKQYNKAIDKYYSYRDLLESNNLVESIKLYLYLLVKTEASDSKIADEIDYFRGKSYVNQETEEFLCSLDDYVKKIKIDAHIKDSYSIDDILELLNSNNENDVAIALNELIFNKNFEAINLPLTVSDILKTRCEMDVIFGMLLDYLIYIDYDDTFLCRSGKSYYQINPHDLVIDKNEQNQLLKSRLDYIKTNEKDLTITRNLINVIIRGSYLLAPNFLLNDAAADSFVAAAYEKVADLFDINLDDDSIYNEFLGKSDSNLVDYYYDTLLNL